MTLVYCFSITPVLANRKDELSQKITSINESCVFGCPPIPDVVLERISTINNEAERGSNSIEEIFGRDVGNMIIDFLRV